MRAMRWWVMAAVMATLPVHDAAAGRCRDAVPRSWDIEVAPANEPGERLVMTGRVRARGGGKPLGGVTVYVYHADRHGEYNAAGSEAAEPRLCGVLITNDRGEYRIRTTMPSGYGGSAPHVHFEIWGSRLGRQVTFVNLHLARGDARGVPPASTRRIDTTGVTWHTDPRPLSPMGTMPSNEETVERGKDGVLRCTHDLVVWQR